MFTPPKVRSQVLSLLVGIVLFCLSGCEVPRLAKVDPDQVDAGAQNVKLSLTGPLTSPSPGGLFTAKSRLIIDGNPDAGPGISQNVPLTFVSSDELTAYLNLDQNTLPGAHTIAVGTVSGISEAQSLFVRCPGCPPPPRMLDLEQLPDDGFYYQGTTPTLKIYARNLLNNDPKVSISGRGIFVDPNIPLSVRTDGTGHDDIELPITIAADASTGPHEVRIITRGGTSDPLPLTVQASRTPRTRITDVIVTGGRCLQQGLNYLTLKGDNFDVGARVSVSLVVDGKILEIEGLNTRLTDRHTLQTEITAPSAVAVDSFDTIIRTVHATGTTNLFDQTLTDRFTTRCNLAIKPVLRSIAPNVVAAGSRVYLKCEGDDFGDGHVVVQEGSGVAVYEVFDPVAGDPAHVRVVGLSIAPGRYAQPVLVTVVDQLGRSSNTQALTITSPSTPYLESVTPSSIPGGGDVDVTVRGSGLFGSIANSIRFSSPGLTISNVVANSSDSKSMTFHVHADPTAPWTNDEATNLVLGNALAFKVNPPVAGPVLLKVTPRHITLGTSAYFKCEGLRFGGPSGPLDVRVQGDSGVSGLISRRPSFRVNPDEVVVPLVTADTLNATTVNLQVRDRQGKLSNAVPLFIDAPVAGRPYLRVFFNTIAFDVRRGFEGGGSVNGANFQGITDVSWRITSTNGLSTPDVTFSNTKVFISSSSSATFDVKIASDAPLTGDVATNLTVTTAAGESNPVACNISP
ncbi:MAG: hypothetical protein QOE26_126 [Verrucomicrobiota bacterium]|jgi:hypothetical protein